MREQAIALCRVSTPEQMANNSLNRQREAVELCAERKNLEIVRWWSGSISSKAGTNVKRKDLNEMLAFCKKYKSIKYLIVDEYDRFMRSGLEGAWYEVEFNMLGVKVWFASEDDTFNADDAMGRFMRQMSAFKAEGSNEERQKKSISGGQKAIREGRLPSGPKAGYRKGQGMRPGVYEIDPVTGPPLKRALKQIAHNIKTPSEALKELVASDFGKHYKNYKMDKFRSAACEEYYCGTVSLKGKLNVRNENGLHEPLITRQEYEKILRIFDRNPKNQQGHKEDKDIEYPLSNDLTCPMCEKEAKKYPRFTSCRINNGRKRRTTQFYEKYRCRACSRYLNRDDTHDSFSDLLDRIVLPYPELKKLKAKLVRTYNTKHHYTISEIQRLEAINTDLKRSIDDKADAATDPALKSIRTEILASIEKLKDQLEDNQDKIKLLHEQREDDLEEFLTFAFDFISDKGGKFFELPGEDMKRCKQLLFTGKIYVDAEKNVYTNEISSIFRGEKNKRDALASQKSYVVRVKRL